MSHIREFLAELRGRGIKLWAEGANLGFDAPKGALTPELRDRLKQRKGELLAYLSKAAAAGEDQELEPLPREPVSSEFIAERPWLVERVKAVPTRIFSLMPMSFAQQRMWFLDQLEPFANYNISHALQLSGVLDLAAIDASFDLLYRRHEILRTTFEMVAGEPMQVLDSRRNMDLLVIDLRAMPRPAISKTAAQILEREKHYPFDLMRGPIFRATLVLGSRTARVLILSMHHIMGDGWSEGLLTRELTSIFVARAQGKPHGLPEPGLQYADYATWQRRRLDGSYLERLLDYWKGELDGIPELLTLPLDHPRPHEKRYQGGAMTFHLIPETARKLHELAGRQNATMFMIVLAVFQATLARYSGQNDICVGFPIANRTHQLIESIIGLFANTLVMRGRLAGKPSLREFLGRVRESTLGAFAHLEMPFEKLVEELRPTRNLSYSPLFQVMMAYQNTPDVDVTAIAESYQDTVPTRRPEPGRGLRAEFLERPEETARFDLELTIIEEDGGLRCGIQYDADIFERDTVAAMVRGFRTLTLAAIEAPDTPLAYLPILEADQRRTMLIDWNATAIAWPSPGDVVAQFEAMARRTPDACAVYDQGLPGAAGPERFGVWLSFRELNTRADHLAADLAGRGVGPETIVPIANHRGADFLIAMLALFKLGAAYLPLDPTHPPERWAAILSQVRPGLLLAHPDYEGAVDAALAESVGIIPDVVTSFKLPVASCKLDVRLLCCEDQLAYVIFTSGSTGKPKGAMVSRAGMFNHLNAKIRDLSLGPHDTVIQNASQSFDISVWQFLAGPLAGGRTAVLHDETVRDPAQLFERLAGLQASVLEVVPSLLETMLREGAGPALPRLRWLVPTGEALPPALCRRWLARYPHAPLLNAYGPTECSDDVTHAVIDEAPAKGIANMSIGKALANTTLYVFDAAMEPAPPRVTGELHVGGAGVGRGYLREPDRTAEVFIPNPFNEDAAGARLYKTGDLVRWEPAGELTFLGRSDHQVKIRGFRIELGEIEAALEEHAAVVKAAVLALGTRPGEKHLIAHVQASEAIDAGQLRAWLHQSLPEYMVPARFALLEQMPLTPNGKIDRKALASGNYGHEADEVAGNEVPPRDSTELRMAAIWERVLERKPIGIRAGFFELGGHSILAVRLMTEIRRVFKQNIPLAALFQGPTIEHLAGLIKAGATQSTVGAVVTLKEEGEKTPFFCVHPIGGTVLCYRELAEAMGDRPFHGIQAPGHEPGGAVMNRIETIAAHYAEAVKAKQPEGPLMIGGWSFGGIVAYEMARVLKEAGRQVEMLALMDPPACREGEETASLLPEMLIHELRFHYGNRLGLTADDLRARDEAAQIQLVTKRANEAGILKGEVDMDQVHRILKVYRAHLEAYAHYRPTGQDVPTVIVQPEVTPFKDAADYWRGLVADARVRRLKGNHYNMVDGENAGALADVFMVGNG